MCAHASQRGFDYLSTIQREVLLKGPHQNKPVHLAVLNQALEGFRIRFRARHGIPEDRSRAWPVLWIRRPKIMQRGLV